jgi:hypothetical protein
MNYHDKIKLRVIIIAPPDQATEGDRIFKKSQGLDGGYTLSYRRENSPDLQRVQDE